MEPVMPLFPTRSSDQSPRVYEVVRETWLTQKPKPASALVAAASTIILALGALIYLQDIGGAAKWMAASYESVYIKGEWWRLWTTLFAHGDAGHLAANTFLFFILGFFLYGYFGARLFPWAALFWGGLINLAVLPTYPQQTNLIGMSGVVYWLGGAWLVLYFGLSRQKNLTQRWLRTLGVAILIFMPAETFEVTTSYRTHFVGFALGLVAGGWHFFAHRKLFRTKEVRETIVEEVDPADDLPPPEGFH
jgi:rhomboid protease GluP